MSRAVRIRRREAHAPAAAWPASVHPVLRRVYAGRGLQSPDEADLRLAGLLAPDRLGGIEAALDLLETALEQGWRLCVVGDFDCDGATGTAVAVRGLRLLGAREVRYRVPHRQLHGYGLSPALVEELKPEAPDLLITVDSGIACRAGVAAARAAGLRVLVTDHHLPGPNLPEADAIVDPNLPGDPFPSKALAGVGVVFFLLLALRARLRAKGRWTGGVEPDLSALLDLVALGTVADLVPLDRNNRILVAAGLKRLRAGQCQPGLRALAEVARRDLGALHAADLGFALGPRINAAGRLEDMSLGIECLLTDSPQRARELAELLDGINAERRGLQQQMLEQADALLVRLAMPGEGTLPPALALFDPDWHPGVVGLVASRLKEQWHRPVIAFAPGEPGGEALRGSARSIPGFHIRDALAEVDTREPGLIERFGGHAMAAGLSLPRAHLERFQAAFAAVAQARLDPADLQGELLSDGPLAGSDFSRELAEALRAAGPWGQGFPEPLFDNAFDVLEWRVLGERHLKYRLRAEGGAVLNAIHFGAWQGEAPPERLHAAYQLETDDFRDRRDVQLLLRYTQCA